MGDLSKGTDDVNVIEVVCKRLAALAAKNEGEWRPGPTLAACQQNLHFGHAQATFACKSWRFRVRSTHLWT